MSKKIRSCFFGIIFIFSLMTLHFVMVNLYFGRKETNRSSDWNDGDYLGIDGEFTPFPIHCSTCALIGMSGHLLNSSLGKEIDDDHLCVFRLGFSPTKGFELHVGSRTTVRIVDSFRFYPFLKQPWKLATGPYKSDIWIVFDRQTGDISRFHGPVLRDLVKKMNSRFLWMARRAERDVLKSLSEANQNIG
ncbi:alpha-N-acetylgalactosaminide alpha-2,6-sialyltransferase 6-like [Uloborus diversus]|uniref:alpha-N-acetylgalactosaminide alpha-2,6-sialyltransferase 6-like n=1 Tax=Uloborus diversus TaxID=327109 RepID=UPI00240A40AE|nr:alpha-N-acetylgalactosaminide alpha-2,6-sialyltransferase 6-like [Uloborus diversus]